MYVDSQLCRSCCEVTIALDRSTEDEIEKVWCLSFSTRKRFKVIFVFFKNRKKA